MTKKEKMLVKKVFCGSVPFKVKCEIEKITDKEIRRVVVDVLCGIASVEDYRWLKEKVS